MNIAVEGCLHGQLEEVYNQLLQLQARTGVKIDALLICGDFQATRDQIDLDYMHCPPKYKSLGSFQKYYSTEKQVPFLTIFIGGNHEAVNYMRDLYFGGWVAPKIYYLGQAGSVFIKKGEHKIRVTGLSGIYNDYDFKYSLKTQRVPLVGKSKISCYHVKQVQIFRIQLLSRIQMMKKQDPLHYGGDSQPFDIFLSHDWPQDIALYGNTQNLYRIKPFLKQEIQKSTLGCLPTSRILKLAQPSYWFSAHMHVKYAALFPHTQNKYTHFLSLDKCLKNRSCLQVLYFERKFKNMDNSNLQNKQQVKLQLDKNWLTVLKLTYGLQLQNRSLYKIQNNSIKLLDSNLMNSYIQKYVGFKQKSYTESKQFQKDFMKWKDQEQKDRQINQTIYLIEKILKEDPNVFNNIIFKFEHKKQEIQQQLQNNDQIDLDL